ncbi:MAG: hypothetical protein SGPRY_007563, partial [Prymnesium sp.]
MASAPPTAPELSAARSHPNRTPPARARGVIGFIKYLLGPLPEGAAITVGQTPGEAGKDLASVDSRKHSLPATNTAPQETAPRRTPSKPIPVPTGGNTPTMNEARRAAAAAAATRAE